MPQGVQRATIYTLHNSTPVRLHFPHFSKYKNSLQMTRKLKTFHFTYLSKIVSSKIGKADISQELRVPTTF